MGPDHCRHTGTDKHTHSLSMGNTVVLLSLDGQPMPSKVLRLGLVTAFSGMCVNMTWEAKARARHRLESSLSESRDSDGDGVSPVVDGSGPM